MLNLFLPIYIFIFFMSTLGVFLKREKGFYIVTTIILTILSMCRFDVGYDYFWYWIVGDRTLEKNSIIIQMYSNLEIGIKWIYKITRYLGNPQYFFMITALITFYFIYRGFYRDSKSPLVTLSIFSFITSGFFEANHIVMQYIAAAIIFYYTIYVLDKKYISFVFIVVLVSYLFHKSAILTLILLFIPKKKINLYFLIISNIIMLGSLKIILPKIVEIVVPQYSYLFTYGEKGQFTNIGNIKYQILIMVFCILIDWMISYKSFKNLFKIIDKDLKYYYYRNIFFIGTLLSIDIEYVFPGDISRRIGVYFILYGFIIFGNCVNSFNFKIITSIKLLTIFLIFLLNMKSVFKYQGVYLNRDPGYNYETKSFNARPNSMGFKLFFGKKYEDMSPYLPGGKRFLR